MALSINVAVGASNCDENESPQVRNSISKADQAMTATGATGACAAHAARASVPSLPVAASNKHSGINKYSKFKSIQLSKDQIEATDEKQASVNQLSEWLANEAAKKNRKPPIHRPLSTTPAIHPLRIQAKPRIKKSDVEATDSKRVSVKTLSSWMSDDPFEQKKGIRTARTGRNVIAKSRVFEKEKEMRADRQCDIKVGSVEERSAWLSGAFKHDGDEKHAAASLLEKKAVIRPYQSKLKQNEKQCEENELMSVREKKEWLSKAFKKGSGGDTIHQTKSFDEQHHSRGGATPAIQQTKSFETKNNGTTPTTTKFAEADDSYNLAINQTKSLDGIGRPVVRLYHKDDAHDESCPEEELKSVHDKQAWLTNAFKKPSGGVGRSHQGSSMGAREIVCKQPNGNVIYSVDSNQDSSMSIAAGPPSVNPAMEGKSYALEVDGADKMSVADRARWLQCAFKK
ncbi:hypothetical protein ACHAXA_004714 [Cyclostephanos tholiformis]|uniref:Uncharacterized protein n=1 Tax=Cyclostephanos tholiformis TaxID=382380 RepID=A0ABD3SRK1_9STRA